MLAALNKLYSVYSNAEAGNDAAAMADAIDLLRDTAKAVTPKATMADFRAEQATADFLAARLIGQDSRADLALIFATLRIEATASIRQYAIIQADIMLAEYKAAGNMSFLALPIKRYIHCISAAANTTGAGRLAPI